MTKELLRETPIFEEIVIEDITEQDVSDGMRLLKIKGVASRGDIFNRNNRMYPTKVLKNVSEKVQPLIKKGKLTGQLDHPSFWGGQGDLERTAIKFTNMWMEGNDLMFEGNVIPTTPGKELEAILRAKVGVGMSTRGYGTLLPFKKNGKEDSKKRVVQDDYELYGVDAVLNESNQHSKIAQFENKEGGIDVELTLETLKAEHPEVVKELEQELTSKIEADFDQKVSEAVEAKLEEQKETVKKEVMESEEVKNLQEFANSVVDMVKPLMPGQQEYEESKLAKENEELKAQVETANAEKDKAVSEAEALKSEKAEAEQKAEVAKYVDQKVEGHRFAESLRKRLSTCSTVEEVDSKFDEEVAYIESFIKPVEDPKGEGKVDPKSEDDSTKENTTLSEEKARQRRLAGLE